MDGIRLVVFFNGQFWEALFERYVKDGYRVARHVFGAEPSEREVAALVFEKYYGLAFSVPLPAEVVERREKRNPKRMQREVRREAAKAGSSTRAQAALQQSYEQLKKERCHRSKQEREERALAKYRLRRLRRKEKHKGH